MSSADKVMLRFNAKIKHWFNSNYVITSKVSNSLDPYQVWTECQPNLGPNCLKGLSADDNVMSKVKSKLKYIGPISTCHKL